MKDKKTIGIVIEVEKVDRLKLKKRVLESEENGEKTTASKLASKYFKIGLDLSNNLDRSRLEVLSKTVHRNVIKK